MLLWKPPSDKDYPTVFSAPKDDKLRELHEYRRAKAKATIRALEGLSYWEARCLEAGCTAADRVMLLQAPYREVALAWLGRMTMAYDD